MGIAEAGEVKLFAGQTCASTGSKRIWVPVSPEGEGEREGGREREGGGRVERGREGEESAGVF